MPKIHKYPKIVNDKKILLISLDDGILMEHGMALLKVWVFTSNEWCYSLSFAIFLTSGCAGLFPPISPLLLLHQLLQLRTYSPAGLTQLTSHLSEPIDPTSFDLFTNLQLLCTQRPAETHNTIFFTFDPSARVAFHHCLDLSQNLSRGKVGNHFPYSSMAARIMEDIDV